VIYHRPFGSLSSGFSPRNLRPAFKIASPASLACVTCGLALARRGRGVLVLCLSSTNVGGVSPLHNAASSTQRRATARDFFFSSVSSLSVCSPSSPVSGSSSSPPSPSFFLRRFRSSSGSLVGSLGVSIGSAALGLGGAARSAGDRTRRLRLSRRRAAKRCAESRLEGERLSQLIEEIANTFLLQNSCVSLHYDFVPIQGEPFA
jgi:hypothetical protein